MINKLFGLAFLFVAAAPAYAQEDTIQPGMQDTTTLDTENQRLQGTRADTSVNDTTNLNTGDQRLQGGAMEDDPESRKRDSTFIALASKDECSWVGIKGTVKTIGNKSFILGYEGGTVAVAFGSEALRQHQFIQDQSVTVYGRVDNDFFERKVIKAKAVVVEGEQPTQHLVIGEGDAIRVLTASHVPGTVVHGQVTNISGRKVILDQAEGMITIDTSTLSYDPTKSEGHKRVEVGDLVTVQGQIRSDFWTGRMLKATSMDIIKFSQLNKGDQGTQEQEQVPQQQQGEDGLNEDPDE